MRRLATGLAVLALLVSNAPLRADEAMATVERGIQAMGGEKNLADMQSMSWKAKGKFYGFGPAMPYTADYAYKAPYKMRMEMQFKAGEQEMKIAVVSNGEKAWESAQGMTQEMPADKLKEFRATAYAMHVSSLLPLKEKGYKLSSLGDSKEGEKTLTGVKVSKEGERDVSLYFDKATGLLSKCSYRAQDEMKMKEITRDVFFEKYFDKDGKKYFTLMVIKHDGQPFVEEEMLDQKPGAVDDKVFEKP